jgi:flavin-binding protein dodecin
MSIARIVEISSTSDKSFENAIEQGIARASKTLRGIKSAWVKEQEVQVEVDKIVAYKVILGRDSLNSMSHAAVARTVICKNGSSTPFSISAASCWKSF